MANNFLSTYPFVSKVRGRLLNWGSANNHTCDIGEDAYDLRNVFIDPDGSFEALFCSHSIAFDNPDKVKVTDEVINHLQIGFYVNGEKVSIRDNPTIWIIQSNY